MKVHLFILHQHQPCQLVHLVVPPEQSAVLAASHQAALLASHQNLVSFFKSSSLRSRLTEVLPLYTVSSKAALYAKNKKQAAQGDVS